MEELARYTLHSLLPSVETPPKTEGRTPKFKELEEKLDFTENLLCSGLGSYSNEWRAVKSVLDKKREEVRGQTKTSVLDDLFEGRALQLGDLNNLRNSETTRVVSVMATSPISTLEGVFDTAEKLGFVVIPSKWFNKKMGEAAATDWSLRQLVNRFYALEESMDVYVLCPPSYYDLGAHIQDEDPNRESYIPKILRGMFMTLSIVASAMRAQQAQINSLDSRISSLERIVSDLKAAFEKLRKDVDLQMKQMQQMVEDQQRENVRANARLAKLEAEIAFRLDDPLLFAVKKGQKLTPNARALIGPAWGEFLDLRVLHAAGLNPSMQQQNKVRKLLNDNQGQSLQIFPTPSAEDFAPKTPEPKLAEASVPPRTRSRKKAA